MNFVGKFDAKLPVDGTGAPYIAHTHVDAASAHAPADAIIVPDAKLLFEGDFKRSGVDLILSKDGQEAIVHDYFKGEKRAALSSPDGAHLTGDIVNALAGHVEYAQAGGGVAAAAAVVGHVTKLMGSATAIRNGVSIILNQGDNIEKGDVLQSGANSTLGVTFIDGTVFGLSSNARMVVNEMVYDPNGSSNSSLLSLVAGTISFVAGETAKHGDMKVDTPVATMGIRGTAVLVEIDFGVPGSNGAPTANFQVLVEPDGTTGSYILFDKTTLTPLATVNSAGTLTKISQGVVSFQSGTGLTPEEQKLITDVFQQKFTDNSNPKSLDHQFTDSLTPQSLTPIKLLDGLAATPIVVVLQGSGSVTQSTNLGAAGTQHIAGPPVIATFNELFNEHIGVSGSPTLDTLSGKINFADINAGDLPTVAVKFTSFTYQNAHQADITASLTPTEMAAVKAVEAISLATDPGNTNTGSATWTYSYPDGAFDFLGAGETLTLTYTAAVNNNFQQSPETAFKTFTVTITGTNDVPVITSSVPQAIAFNGGTNVPGGDLIAHVPTSGTISFNDPDLTDTHTVSVNLLQTGLDLPPAPLEIFEHALTASIITDSTGTGSGTIKWQLADLPVYLGDFVPQGQTITLTYAVTVTDSQGATSTQDITVTITGTDTPAVVWIATSETGSAPGELLWSNASNWETGTVPTIDDDAIVITNQLIGLTPSFPLTVDAPAEARSLSMNDFGTTPPELINQSTLTLAGALKMAADSIIHNSGTISVGGLIEVQDTSVLDNSGTLLLEQGGDFSGQSIITNTGSIEISGGTLHVQVDVANAGQGEENVDGQITIDSGAALALGAASIIGGTVINDGTLALDTDASEGSSVLQNGTLNNNQTLQAGSGAELRNETVTNEGTVEVLALGALLLDQGTTINNANGTIAVDGTGTLTLNDASIDGGTINNFSPSEGGDVAGTIDVTGSSTISNANLNYGSVTIESGQTLTLDGDTVTGTGLTNVGTGSAIHVDGGDNLSLNGVTLGGGGFTIGTAALVKTGGDVTVTNTAVANDGTIEVTGGTLKIVGGSVASDAGHSGSIQIDTGAVLDLDGSDSQTVVFNGANAELRIDTPSFGGIISGLAATDEIDLSTIGYGPGTTGTYIDGVLTITDGPHSISMTLSGDTSNLHFASSSDGHGGTLITLNALDDAPVIAVADKAETANVSELASTTGSSALDPSPAASGTLHFTDIDLTDRPTADVALSVTWTNGSTDLSSSLTSAENSALESAFTLSQSGNTNNGTLGWTYQISDSALDFLGAGETAKVTATITLDDHQGGTDTATVTVTLDGANDVPVIVSETDPATQTIALEKSPIVLAAGTSTNALGLQTETFDEQGIPVGSVLNNGAGHGSFHSDALNATFTSSGNAGVVNGSSSATAPPFIGPPPGHADGTNYLSVGANGSETITFATEQNQFGLYWGSVDSYDTISFYNGDHLVSTYSGTDIAPLLASGNQGSFSANGYVEFPDLAPFTKVVLASSSNAFEVDNISAGFHSELAGPITGTLTVSDADIGDTLTGSVIGNAVAEYNGSTTLPSNLDVSALIASGAITFDTVKTTGGPDVLEWTYNPANPDLSFLEPGDTLTLTFNATVSDGHATTANQPLTITLVGSGEPVVTPPAQNHAPSISAIGGALTEASGVTGSGATDTATGTISFSDADLGDHPTVTASLASAHPFVLTDAHGNDLTATLTSAELADITAVENGLVLSPDSVNANNGTVGWTYSVTDAALDFLAAGDTLTLNYTATVNDQHGGVATAPIAVTVHGSNDAPVVDAHDATLSYTAGQTPAAIDPGLTVSDVDSATLGSATVQISGNFIAGEDVLGFTDQNGIHGSYNADTGVLTLTGTSSVANYEAALASVTYSDHSSEPSTAARTISFTVDDGAGANSQSNAAMATVNVAAVQHVAAATTTLTFDNLSSSGNDGPIPQGYGGLDWSNFYFLNGHQTAPVSGYANGTVSVPNVAFNAFADNASIDGTTFNFVGADLTSAWNTGLIITVSGYDHDALVDQQTVVVDTLTPTWFEFNFNGITDLVFSSSGGTSAGYSGAGAHFAMDDFTYSVFSNPDASIAAGGSFEIGSASADEVVFSSSTGTLVLDNPSSFTGKIAGISGKGDVLDLGGFDAAKDTIVAATGSGSYDSASGMTSLTVTDETTKHSVSLNLAGDYSASTWTVTGDGHGGANVADPPPPMSATIATSGSLEISSDAASTNSMASSENITFQGSTGSLTLDHPAGFTGTISGFTGDGTLSGSDQIDLKGIDYNSHSFSESFNANTDTLSVTDGTNSALLHFNGTYEAANFSFTTDNSGGTIVFDPPVTDTPAAKPAAVTATSNGFVFSFADHGHDPSGVHPTTDTHLFDGQTFVNADADHNKPHDDNHGQSAAVPESMDAATIAAVKAQLHAHDFHFA